MLIIGLTGSIASGKSTASLYFKEKYNFTIVDADLIAREVVQPGRFAYRLIVSHFKYIPDLLLENGELNRPELGKVVFKDRRELRYLNLVTHPFVYLEILKKIFLSFITFKQLIILDVPLLFESGFLRFICNYSISILCSPKIQKERLLKRNPHLSEADADNRINNQLSNLEKIKRSDFVFDNNKGKEYLYQKLDDLAKSKLNINFLVTVFESSPPIALSYLLLTITKNYLIPIKQKNPEKILESINIDQ
ncbi:putative dephospho-CoA kinase [Ascoidea rubescens DSM 1968]|uniref:CoaE-domain-containing protein n=1 Tax=Ascoidea rubescens DSM 1968 TaxID=1344418 RepID=A0A1D2VBG6_9ASCO|nr:CoaE-domain-containing protein [Ascoidea rubescens DSM 1968]ODV58966.1 CoaE-domain-containing protein [Ascoidea rubescens DSM 1968]